MEIRRRRTVMRWTALIACLAPTCLYAAEPVGFGKETIKLDLGAFIAYRNSGIEVGTPANPATGDIALEKTLNLESPNTTFYADGYLRFLNRNRIMFEYYSFNRSAGTVLNTTVQWRDTTYPLNASVHAESQIQIIPLKYAFSFYKSDHLETAFSLGAYWLHAKASIQGTANSASLQRQASSARGLLPVVGLAVDYSPTPQWVFGGSFDYFGYGSDTYSGNFKNAKAYGEYRPFHYFGIGVAYKYVNFHLKVDKANWDGHLNMEYQGPVAYGIFRF